MRKGGRRREMKRGGVVPLITSDNELRFEDRRAGFGEIKDQEV